MASRFDACLPLTLEQEGGYSNDPRDPGGPTMHGIIQREYDAWRRRQGLPTRPVRQIELHEEQAIYRAQYWDAVQGDHLPAGVDRCVWDMGVNAGVGTSVKKLQMCLGLPADAHMGQVTIDAAHAADPHKLVADFCGRWRAYYRSLKGFRYFGRGWLARVDAMQKAALADLAAAPPRPAPPVVPAPETDPETVAPSSVPGNVSGIAPEDEFVTRAMARASDPTPDGMLASSTGNTAAMVGTGGSTQVAVSAGQAAAAASERAAPFTLSWYVQIALELAQRPEFWAALAVVGGAFYVWLERRRHLKEHGI